MPTECVMQSKCPIVLAPGIVVPMGANILLSKTGEFYLVLRLPDIPGALLAHLHSGVLSSHSLSFEETEEQLIRIIGRRPRKVRRRPFRRGEMGLDKPATVGQKADPAGAA